MLSLSIEDDTSYSIEAFSKTLLYVIELFWLFNVNDASDSVAVFCDLLVMAADVNFWESVMVATEAEVTVLPFAPKESIFPFFTIVIFPERIFSGNVIGVEV